MGGSWIFLFWYALQVLCQHETDWSKKSC
jgi:hypothetical protein